MPCLTSKWGNKDKTSDHNFPLVSHSGERVRSTDGKLFLYILHRGNNCFGVEFPVKIKSSSTGQCIHNMNAFCVIYPGIAVMFSWVWSRTEFLSTGRPGMITTPRDLCPLPSPRSSNSWEWDKDSMKKMMKVDGNCGMNIQRWGIVRMRLTASKRSQK